MMKKIWCAITILFFFVCMNFTVKATEEKDQKILFISSYSMEWYNTAQQYKGIIDSINPNVEVEAFYLNTKNKEYTVQYEREIYNVFLARYDEIQTDYSAIITGDDVALSFVYKYHNELFTEKYVIFEGVNGIHFATQVAQNEYFYGVCEKVNYLLNVEFALDLMPNATKINIIYDSTIGGLGEYEQFKSEVQPILKSLNYNYINTTNYNVSELIEVFQEIKKNEITIFLILNDCKDTYLTSAEGVELVKRYIDAPVFRVNSVGGDDVFLGGYLYSHYFAGQLAAGMVNVLLNEDVDVSDLHVNYTASFECIINYQVLKKYGFDTSSLPSDVVYIDYNPSIFELYEKQIIGFSALAVLIVAIIALLISLVLKYWKQNKTLEYYHDYDASTSLLSKNKLQQDINNLMNRGQPFTFMVVDIDNFKMINDYYGHKLADLFIAELGKKLTKLISNEVSIYRFGGDEFALIYHNIDIDKINALALAVLGINNNIINVENHAISFTVSIGCAIYPTHAEDSFTLFSNADAAMYTVKETVKNDFAIYDPAIMYDSKTASIIVESIKEAIDNNKVFMLYQPIYNTKKKRIDSAEALMRIKDFPYGPQKFIPAAEKSGLMITLGRIATKQVIETLADLMCSGHDDVSISVNFSGIQIMDESYLDYVNDLLTQYDINHNNFKIEFTESINVVDERRLGEFFKKANDLGIKIMLDDFGTGYSSILNLTKYDYSVIKFDKQITETVFNKRSFTSLLAYCHSFGYPVVAEGVEDKKQFDYLVKLGVEYVQGYYLHKPLSINDFLDVIYREEPKSDNE